MRQSIDEKIQKIIDECLEEFESSKGSLSVAIKKLKRASELIDYQGIVAWCDLQLGNPKHINVAKEYIDAFIKYNESEEKDTTEIQEKSLKFKELGFKLDEENLRELNAELTKKANQSSGGLESIGFIEEKYNDLVRTKRGNDDTYYKSNLNSLLNLIKSTGHKKATFIYNKIAFKDIPKTSFDYLKSEVDDRLLDLSPELAEQLMITFKSVSSNSKEELSHSLTTCRRIIEKFADLVFPPREELHKGRKVGKSQYINRLWAYIDIAIESNSNKVLAQKHLEFLGNYLEANHKLSNKGVHSELTKIEAIKTVFHLYLIFADLLDYLNLDVSDKKNGKLDINKASIDELEALGNLKRNIAKEIIKARVKNERLTEKILLSIKGIGAKTMSELKENFNI